LTDLYQDTEGTWIMKYDYDVAIIGAGAAGLTAGIYCGRSGLSSVVFDSKTAGGLTLTSPEIENYPGFPTISGPDLMANIQKHAEKWCTLKEIETVKGLTVDKEGVSITTSEKVYSAGAIILCMGVDHEHLGVPGEKEFAGKGVSYCATCDGFFFKEKRTVQVGGGNTAALEALYQKGLGVEVSIVHRRDRLKADDSYRKRIKEAKIPVLFNSIVKEIHGDTVVSSVTLEDTLTGKTRDLPIEGVFIAVGMRPNNTLAKMIGVELLPDGNIKVNARMETNVRRVYAAGDITGGVRQIVTAAAQGTVAALSTLEVLGKSYPF
jgi:thioredoxin reductase (NADPH)